MCLRGDDKDKDFEGEKPRPEAGMVQYIAQSLNQASSRKHYISWISSEATL